MSVLKGDYIGFSYNGKHSSELGIIRTSDGSRFNEDLLPTMQDKTVQVPGGDGTYYFGSYYTARQFSISFAFDSLTEGQVQQLKRHFGDRKIHDLVFDELPYKIYQAKVTSSATLKYIAFEEGATERIYKGEGTIQFTAYNPFARVRYKYLDQYSEDEQIQSLEWNDAARLLLSQGNFDKRNSENRIAIYNPGDIESDFIFTVNFIDGKIPASKLSLTAEDGNEHQLAFKQIEAMPGDSSVAFNTKNNLIEGFNAAGKKTGNIYNRYIVGGDFFKIPVSLETERPVEFIIDNINGITANLSESPLSYSYLYF